MDLTSEIKTSPFWTDDTPFPADVGNDPLPRHADVAIVGGGYTGLSAARRLGQLGVRAVVLDAQAIGWGASSRNGGMTTTGLKLGSGKLMQQFGSALGRELWQASLDAITCVESIVNEEKIDCGFARFGSLQLASKPQHYDRMCRDTEWMSKTLNFHRRMVAKKDLSAEIQSAHFHGGVLDVLSGGLHPAKYVFGLARSARKAGASLCGSTEVRSLQHNANGYQIVTSAGDLSAGSVLIATNGYTGDLDAAIRRRVMPIGSYIIVTEPLLPALQREIVPRSRMFFTSKWFLNYFRLTSDGRLLFGGRASLSAGLDLMESARRLRVAMIQIFPQLHDVEITHSWSGKLGLTFDTLPHIGCVNGLHYALGYSGHGVAVATYLGQQVAELIAGKRHRSAFLEINHPTRFYYRKRAWFLPLVSCGLRTMDWIT